MDLPHLYRAKKPLQSAVDSDIIDISYHERRPYPMKATVICFSPTGNSRASAIAMAKAIADETEVIDLTASAALRMLSPSDFAIFAAPVYAGRIPYVAAERFAAITGNNTPCIIVASYGNRHYDDALLEMADIAAEQGFIVRGAAAVIGRHTYGEIQTDRPNEDDFAQMRTFAQQALANAGTPAIPGNRPYREGGKGGKFRQLTGDACIHCGLCARNCPTHAIGSDHISVSEGCISCFRCIRNCPKKAKHMNTPEYNDFAAMFTQKLSQRRENEFFL